jgi:hypothetical protein
MNTLRICATAQEERAVMRKGLEIRSENQRMGHLLSEIKSTDKVILHLLDIFENCFCKKSEKMGKRLKKSVQ